MRCFVALCSVSLFSVICMGETVEIPFLFNDGFMTVAASAPGTGAPLNLLVDSGASASVLSLRTARKLRVPLGPKQPIFGVGSRAVAYHLDSFQSSVGTSSLPPFSLAADLSMANEICSVPIDGLVGIEFFRDRIVQVDYEHACLRILDAPPANQAIARLPIEFRNGVVCVPVSVNGSRPRFTRLDTGCNDALHWVVPRASARQQERHVSIGFATDPRNMVLTDVVLGNHAINHLETAIHTEPLFTGEAGLLGNGTLSRFTVTVNWRDREVLLHDRAR
jgi:hypothetical protein